VWPVWSTSDGRRATAPPKNRREAPWHLAGRIRPLLPRSQRERERARNTYPPAAREAAETGRDFSFFLFFQPSRSFDSSPSGLRRHGREWHAERRGGGGGGGVEARGGGRRGDDIPGQQLLAAADHSGAGALAGGHPLQRHPHPRLALPLPAPPRRPVRPVPILSFSNGSLFQLLLIKAPPFSSHEAK
jgi:hypothetical protein